MKAQRLVTATLGLLVLTVAALWAHGKSPTRIAGPDGKAKSDPQPAADGGPATKAATRPASPPAFVGQAKDEWESYQAMHAYILDRFIKSDGFGLRRTFEVNDEARVKKIYADGVRYNVGQVDLISLNDGKEPFVYQSKFEVDATKNRLQDTPHVPLVEGEADALAQLKDGKEVVLTGADGKRELVGAVRATADCMKCHSVKEGTLLGAFRYPLEREELPPEEQGK